MIAVQPASKFFRSYAGVFGNVSMPVCVTVTRVFSPWPNNSNVTSELPWFTIVAPGVGDLLFWNDVGDAAKVMVLVAFVFDHELEFEADFGFELVQIEIPFAHLIDIGELLAKPSRPARSKCAGPRPFLPVQVFVLISFSCLIILLSRPAR